MTRLPIPLRLALAFALVMALGLGAVGLFVYGRVGADLDRALNLQLRSRFQDVAPLIARDGSLTVTGSGFVERGESFVELVDRGGAILAATPSLQGARLLTPADLAAARRGAVFRDRTSVVGLDEGARLLAGPVGTPSGLRVLVVGATREPRAEALTSLRRELIVGGLLALLLASLAGYALARSALRPVEAMRRRARRISASSPGERLPVGRSSDEVSSLATTLNEMLDRLAAALERERSFVANASHELRTPLALLKTELELALLDGTTREELEESLRAAAAESDRMARLADDLLVLARADGGLPLKLEPIDVDDLLRTVVGRFDARARAAGGRLSIEAGRPIVITGDRLRLEQALTNIVDNALRHGAGTAVVGVVEADREVAIHVRDTGPGIDPAFLPQAFERFTRAGDARGRDGAGLGLAIVAAIAQAHGGAAGAEAADGGGADVWFSVRAR